MRKALKAAVASIAFLTRIPVPGAGSLDANDVARAVPLFPLVGAGLGAAVGLVAVGLDRAGVAPFTAATIAVAAGALLTGALHLDALADSCDALGGHTRERKLEIMRDHAIGTYGAVALILVLVARIAAISTLLSTPRPIAALAAAGAVSRAASVSLAAVLPYANPRAGSGASVVSGTTALRAGLACAVALILAGILVQVDAIWLVAVAVGVVAIVGLHSRSRLGGVTGDTLGATSELTETAGLVLLSALR